MSDFIREVDEEYRRDRVVTFLAKYQLLLIGLAVAIVAGAGGYRFYQDHQTQTAQAANTRYDAALQFAREGKVTEAQAAFDAIQGEGPRGYAMLARLKAVEALATHDPAAAVKGFDSIAQDDSVDASLRDAAQIRGAYLRVDIEDPKAFEARYAPVAQSGFAFRASLRELLALAAFKRDDTEAAGRWLDQIVIDQRAPSALRSRAEAFLSLVAAGPAAIGVPEAVKPILEAPPEAGPLVPPTAPPPAAAASPATTTPADKPAATTSPATAIPAATTSPAVTPPAAKTAAPVDAIPPTPPSPAGPSTVAPKAMPAPLNPTSPSPAGAPPAD